MWCFQTSIYTFSLNAFHFPPGQSGPIYSFLTYTHKICMTTVLNNNNNNNNKTVKNVVFSPFVRLS